MASRDTGRRPFDVLAVLVIVSALLVGTVDVALGARVRVRADAERWRPAHLFITEGDTVIWKNPDDRRHNVVAYGGGWRFSELLRPGEKVRRVFDVRPGGDPYAYRCTLHSAIVDGRCEGMCGLVHVFGS
ncbi:MAG: hypothetical protein L0206_01990 [Actinobacteria bacterium]|nr:hypothetical protein [Actinomycetota bacterium]